MVRGSLYNVTVKNEGEFRRVEWEGAHPTSGEYIFRLADGSHRQWRPRDITHVEGVEVSDG